MADGFIYNQAEYLDGLCFIITIIETSDDVERAWIFSNVLSKLLKYRGFKEINFSKEFKPIWMYSVIRIKIYMIDFKRIIK